MLWCGLQSAVPIVNCTIVLSVDLDCAGIDMVMLFPCGFKEKKKNSEKKALCFLWRLTSN